MSIKNIDLGSKMNFGNARRAGYSLATQKENILTEEQENIVRIQIDKLESAPEEWNFYPALQGEEFDRLVHSILVHGLLHPIVVQKKQDKTMILSGHNRVRAYRFIRSKIQELKSAQQEELNGVDITQLNAKDFDEIYAIIKEDLSEEDAREIIIDANYAQRQLGQKLLTRSIIEKYKIIQQKRKENTGDYKSRKTREIVAESFQMSGRHIDRYRKLDKLNPILLDWFYKGKISLEMGAKIAMMKPNIQEEIAEHYLPFILKYPAQTLQYFKAGMTKKELAEMKQEILEEKNICKISFVRDGVHHSVTLQEESQIEEMISLLKTWNIEC